jgi:hypothetical protein
LHQQERRFDFFFQDLGIAVAETMHRHLHCSLARAEFRGKILVARSTALLDEDVLQCEENGSLSFPGVTGFEALHGLAQEVDAPVPIEELPEPPPSLLVVQPGLPSGPDAPDS